MLVNLYNLADPTWELNLTRAGMNPGDTAPSQTLAAPEGVRRFLPRDLAEVEVKPMDERRIILLRGEYGAPAHAIVGMDVYKGTYQRWVTDPNKSGEPPHISRQWNKGEELVELFPLPIDREILQYFMLGLFTDWLAKVKGIEAVKGLVRGLDRGYVYREGRSYYAVHLREDKQTGELEVERRRVRLTEPGQTGIEYALKGFSGKCIESAKLYMERLEQRIAWEELRELLKEYRLEVLKPQIEATRKAERREILQEGEQVLKEYEGST